MLVAMAMALVLPLASFGVRGIIEAQSLQQQIDDLSAQNNEANSQVDSLALEAASYQDAINVLTEQINAYQREINQRQAESESLQAQIAEKEAELVKQRDVLGENIKDMYLEGDISTIEMLATSNDLSDYLDKQRYREITSNSMKTTLDKVTSLKVELNNKKEEVERILKQQEQLRADATAQKAEQDRLLSFNQSQQSEFNAQIQENQSKIKELKQKQFAENARLFGSGGGQVGGGGYPWGNAPCVWTGNISGACYDYEWGYNGPGSWRNWETGGYAYRNCTDYVAWKTGASGGLGNANTWYQRAPSYGYATGATPQVGAAAVSGWANPSVGYGHVMYVEAVYADGSILISDYNRAGPGEYGTSVLSASTASALRYVYF